ncbi:MAG: DUF4492 domain-containing protein [Dysgonamonadaceae bacterium]|jgi:hypothetical protein|nr:DUF4492 domain-containing protein [Dysgonamonadaceae bacterium]
MTENTIANEKFNWFKMFWDGFMSMSTLGKTLWVVVIVKLIIMFAILKPFFFSDFLSSKDDKASYVSEELVDRSVSLPLSE